MKKLIFSALLLASVSTATVAQDLTDLYKQGRDAYNKKQYENAVTSLNEVVKQDENNLMAWFYRGVSNLYLKNYEQSIADLDRAIELYPVRADFYYFRALARKEMKDLKMAHNDLSNAIALDDKQAHYYYERASVGLALGESNTQAERGETEQTDATNATAIMDLDMALALSPKLKDKVVTQRKETFKKLTINEIELLPLTASGKNGVVPDDQKTIEVKKYITTHKFESLLDGKAYYDEVFLKSLPSGKKATVLAMLRNKVMKDVFGDALYQEDLDQMRLTLDRESWLLPEGRNYYFNMMQNSKYIFSGGVQRGKVYYFYKVNKTKTSEKYRVLMYGVYNGESNLVYDSQIAYSEDSLGRNVQVFFAQNSGYRWTTNTDNYLKATVEDATNTLAITPVGSVVELSNDNKHGLPKEKYNKAIKPTDKGSVATIKATLNYLILEYVKMMHKPSWWAI